MKCSSVNILLGLAPLHSECSMGLRDFDEYELLRRVSLRLVVEPCVRRRFPPPSCLFKLKLLVADFNIFMGIKLLQKNEFI